MNGWEVVAGLRNDFADMVEGLDETRLDAPTLCGTWSARDITGHLVAFVDLGLPSFFANMARHGFDYDRAADTLARRTAERQIPDLISTLRAKAAKKSAIPLFPPEMTGADVAVHTQDVRRPLRLPGSLRADDVITALDFLTSHRMAGSVIDAKALDGLSFDAPDLDWSTGDGPLVSGSGEAIMMAICGRPTHGELTGTGVALLKERQEA